jgi:hypothetical protein
VSPTVHDITGHCKALREHFLTLLEIPKRCELKKLEKCCFEIKSEVNTTMFYVGEPFTQISSIQQKIDSYEEIFRPDAAFQKYPNQINLNDNFLLKEHCVAELQLVLN